MRTWWHRSSRCWAACLPLPFRPSNRDISEQYPWLSTARKSFPTAQRRSNSTYYQNFSELQLETILAAHVQQAVLGVCSPEEALKQAQEDCNRYFQPW